MSDLELKGHPLALIFPRPSAAAQAELGASIAARGQRELIVLLDGMILDGLTRYSECRRLGIAAKVRLFDPRPVAEGGDGPSPLDFVEDRNLHRRDLTTGQRAAIAAEIGRLRQGRPAAQDNPANLQLLPDASPQPAGGQVREDRAEKYQVSERTLADADKVFERSPDQLHPLVKAGAIVPDVAAALSEKSPEEVKQLLDALPRDEAGKLTPAAKREVRKVAAELREELNAIKKQRREQREREQGAMQLAAPNKYGVILADPEWRFEPYSRETGMDRAADNHYATSTLEELTARRALIDELAADGDVVLGLWITDIANGIKLAEAWGFTVKSFRIWVKDVVDQAIDAATLHALKLPEGRYLRVCGAPGPGFWGRSRGELMLICVRGAPACPAMGTQGENVWFAARPHIEGTNKDLHSAKPEETAHDFFDTHFPSYRKVELNARSARPGWDRWGLEAPKGEGWIGPVPVSEAHKFAPADEDPEAPADDADDEVLDLPPMPWAAGDNSEPGDAEHAAEAHAESENEAAEAAGQPA